MSAAPAARPSLPPSLLTAAAWTWRALVLLAGGWVLFEAAKRLYLITLPFAAGILLTALAHPLVAFLRRRGVHRAVAVLVTGLVLAALVAGVGAWVVSRAISQGPLLVTEASHALARLPISDIELSAVRDRISSALSQRAGTLAGTIIGGLTAAGEVATGVLITVFVTLFLLARGREVWAWAVSLAPTAQRATVDRMGAGVWTALTGWTRGTVLIAAFHGTVIGTVLVVMGVPLAASLAVLVFVGSFIPVIGAFVFGGFAVLVTFATQGLVPAAVLLGVLLVENQFEAHVLQPFLVGRYVHLNGLAVVAALTAGGLLWGIAGAALAVPLTAATHAALAARHQQDPGRPPGPGVLEQPGAPEGADPEQAARGEAA